MKPTPAFIFLVVTLVSSVSGVPDHFTAFKARFEAWKKCHQGFLGLSPKQLAAAEKCHGMNIEDEDCYITCYRTETGSVKGGHYVRGAAIANMAAMWDNTHEIRGAIPMAKLTWDCVKAYEEKGNKWSSNYTGTCGSKDFNTMVECIRESRECN